ncbi:hypothetical protein PSPO01_09379 [Paraphaeosphaeria sporulosa]
MCAEKRPTRPVNSHRSMISMALVRKQSHNSLGPPSNACGRSLWIERLLAKSSISRSPTSYPIRASWGLPSSLQELPGFPVLLLHSSLPLPTLQMRCCSLRNSAWPAARGKGGMRRAEKSREHGVILARTTTNIASAVHKAFITPSRCFRPHNNAAAPHLRSDRPARRLFVGLSRES